MLNLGNGIQQNYSKNKRHEINKYNTRSNKTCIGKKCNWLTKRRTISKQLKRLKYMRIRIQERETSNIKLNKFLNNHFPTAYYKQSIFTGPDFSIKGTLDFLEGMVNYAAKAKNIQIIFQALNIYETISLKNGNSTRILFQKAETHALLSAFSQSVKRFDHAIDIFNQILYLADVTDNHFIKASQRAVSLLEDRKYFKKAIVVQSKLYVRFPYRRDVLNKLGWLYLTINDLPNAKALFYISLIRNEEDKFAMANLGYTLYFEASKMMSIHQDKVSEAWDILEYSTELL